MYTKTYAVVDLETTGHSPAKGDRIIQIAIVFIRNGIIGEKYVRFVNPGQKIPVFIRGLTNIDDEDVEKAPFFEEIAAEVRDLLEGAIFVAHNTDFDLSFLQSEFKRCGLSEWTGKQIDTVELAKIVFPSSPSYRLQDLATELDIELPSAHRADDDALATSELLLASYRKLEMLPEAALALLHRRSFRLKSDLSSLFYEALKGARKKTASPAFASFRGIPYRRIESSTASFFKEVDYPEKNNAKAELLKKTYPCFEWRESQFEFMDAVWKTLNDRSEVAAEVPTGIGKTIAYLLPATVRSVQTGKPVVISTYTNHLADKILDAEIDKLRSIFDLSLKATVLKGREQYISLGKFEELLMISEESYDETLSIMQILVWLTETSTGDLDELNVSGGGQLFIDRIRNRFRHMAPDEQAADFHSRLMQECAHSNFIITNHAMLLADMNKKQPMFTSVAGVIIDEAHQFTQVASRFDEVVFSYTNWKYIMGQVGSDAEGQLMYQLFALADRHGLSLSNRKYALVDSFAQFTEAFDYAIELLVRHDSSNKRKQQHNRQTHSLSKLKGMEKGFANVAAAMGDYISKAEAMGEYLKAQQNDLTRSEQALLSEWNYWIREIKIKAGEWVELFLDRNLQNTAIWLEKDRRSIPGSIKVVKRTLDGSEAIIRFKERFQQDRTGIVWTSGTMTIQDNARYIPDQLGLSPDVPLMHFEAPVHFYDGAEVFIVEDMPDIQQVSQTDYIEAVTDAIIRTVMATGGKLFILFTSQDMLRKTYDLIVESEQLEEYALFAQGVSSGSRMRLLKSFRQFDHAVLFGTSSFWEGVDVPGDALSAVIVVRLPFSSPEEPVFVAKSEKIAAQGLNPFKEYALPEAVMRMRQGFGRLIRASSDKGAFIILDRRIDTKSYGKQFLQSLPDVPVRKVSLEKMVNSLESCYNKYV